MNVTLNVTNEKQADALLRAAIVLRSESVAAGREDQDLDDLVQALYGVQAAIRNA